MRAMVVDIFASGWLLIMVLMSTFVVLTRWALGRLKLVRGYLLGVLVGLLFVVVASTLIGERAALPTDAPPRTDLMLAEVGFACIVGAMLGLFYVLLSSIGGDSWAGQSLKVTLLTALHIALPFVMVVTSLQTRRLIGIGLLTLACVIVGWQIVRRQLVFTPPQPPHYPTIPTHAPDVHINDAT